MEIDVLLPDLGADTAVLSVWFADTGDQVYCGDRLVEVLVDGATFDVASPATGRLTQKHARMDQTLHIGQRLAVVQADAEE